MMTRLHALIVSACVLTLETLAMPMATFAQGTAGLECWAAPVSQVAQSLSSAERTGVAPLTRVLDRAERLLRGNAAIASLGGTRARLHRFIGHPASAGAPLMAESSVWLHRRPDVFGPNCTLLRGADYTHHAELSIQLNQLDAFYQLLENPQEVTEAGTFPLPNIVDSVRGVPVYGHADGGTRVLVLTRAGVVPFVKVPGDEYRWRVNPALFAGSAPGDVRVLAVVAVVNDDADAQKETLQRFVMDADVESLRELFDASSMARASALRGVHGTRDATAVGGPRADDDIAQPPVNLLTRAAGARVVGFSSEFGAGWVAENLVPTDEQLDANGKPIHDLVWSSGSSVPFPHWVTIDLGKRQWLTTLVFNNALSEEPDHPGISARLLEVHVGESPTAMKKVASFELQKNATDQAVQIAPVEARYVKFVVRSNWGHPWYTELGASMAFDDGTRPGSLAAVLRDGGRADVYGIYFDFASAMLRSESDAALTEIVAWHTANPTRALVIEGHTDAAGSELANAPLSEKRAAAVVAELVKRGVPATKLSPRGFGSRKPVATNDTDAGRARNRRVTVAVVP